MLCEIPETERAEPRQRVFDTEDKMLLTGVWSVRGFEGDKCTCSLLPPPDDGCITLFGPALIKLHL